MPLMISRIGHARGRPVLFAAGRWGSITRHSLSVTSVWYRFVSRICCFRVVGVHMVSSGLVSATPLESRRFQPLNLFRNGLLTCFQFPSMRFQSILASHFGVQSFYSRKTLPP